MSPIIHPNGFHISDRPVAALFAHPYSFQAIQDKMYQDATCIMSCFNMGGVEDTFVKYWDEATTVVVMEFKVQKSVKQREGSDGVATKKEKERKKKVVIFITIICVIHFTYPPGTVTTSTATASHSVLRLSDKPVTLSLNKTLGNVKLGPAPVGML